MPLLIDAYNVLHETMPPALAGLDTAGLCQALARTPWRHEIITVVCDGQPGPLGLTDSPTDDVTLIYSGIARTADAVIIEHIDADSSPRRLTVVSSDREIRKAARRRRAASWTSEQFLHNLVNALRQGPGAIKADKPTIDKLDRREIRNWLEMFGYEDTDDGTSHDPPW